MTKSKKTPDQSDEPKANIYDNDDQQPVAKDIAKTKEPLLRRLIPWLVVIILALTVMFGGWFAYQSTRRDADAIAGRMMKAIINNNQSAAYNLTSPTFRLNTSQSQLEASLNQISSYLSGGKFKQTDRYFWSKDGQITTVSTVYSVTTPQKTYYARILLDKVDSKWLVTVFRISETELKAIEP